MSKPADCPVRSGVDRGATEGDHASAQNQVDDRWFPTCVISFVAGIALLGAGLILRHQFAQHLADQLRTGHPVTATVVSGHSWHGGQPNYMIEYPSPDGLTQVRVAQFDPAGGDLVVGSQITAVIAAGHPRTVVTANGYTSQTGQAFALLLLVSIPAVVALVAVLNVVRILWRRRRVPSAIANHLPDTAD